MKLTRITEHEFLLEAENELDRDFIDAADMNRQSIQLQQLKREELPGKHKSYRSQFATFCFDPNSARALEAQSERECLSAIRQISRLLIS